MNASNATSTIDPREAAHFGRMAPDWWDPHGSSAMLHRLNPVRLRYIREQVDRHWALDERERRPLVGKRAIDVGCGAGLLAEPLARLGAEVVAIDAAPENIHAAREHADAAGLAIDYRAADVERVEGGFDLVTCLEVIEHVPDPARFVRALAGLVAPGGLLIMSTPNRTARSRILLITLGEGLGRLPRGTHDWDRFLTPAELAAMIEAVGLQAVDRRGIGYSPARGFSLTEDLSLNYLMTAERL